MLIRRPDRRVHAYTEHDPTNSPFIDRVDRYFQAEPDDFGPRYNF
jgi:hypothetical protein